MRRVVVDLSNGSASVLDADGRLLNCWSGHTRRVVEARVRQRRGFGKRWGFAPGSQWRLTSPPDGFWREVVPRS